MTQTLWITQGTYSDQWITMKDVDATDARTHHFGFVKAPLVQVPGIDVENAENSFVAADVSFLLAWQARLQTGTYNPRETGAANVAPTALALTPSTYNRLATIGTLVGTITATDADQTGGHVFTSADANFGFAGINGDQVVSLKTPGPTAGAYAMTVTATDAGGLSFTGPVTITVS